MTLRNACVLIIAATSIAIAADQNQTKAGMFGKAPAKMTAMVVPFVSNGQTASAAITSTPIREVMAKEITVAAGDHAILESNSDFSGAGKVGLAVTTLSDPKSTMTNVRFGMAWAGPGDWYVLTDVIDGSMFYYLDHGGATVPVYGPSLKVAVFNDGSTPVTITQLSVNAVAR